MLSNTDQLLVLQREGAEYGLYYLSVTALRVMLSDADQC